MTYLPDSRSPPRAAANNAISHHHRQYSMLTQKGTDPKPDLFVVSEITLFAMPSFHDVRLGTFTNYNAYGHFTGPFGSRTIERDCRDWIAPKTPLSALR